MHVVSCENLLVSSFQIFLVVNKESSFLYLIVEVLVCLAQLGDLNTAVVSPYLYSQKWRILLGVFISAGPSRL